MVGEEHQQTDAGQKDSDGFQIGPEHRELHLWRDRRPAGIRLWLEESCCTSSQSYTYLPRAGLVSLGQLAHLRVFSLLGCLGQFGPTVDTCGTNMQNKNMQSDGDTTVGTELESKGLVCRNEN